MAHDTACLINAVCVQLAQVLAWWSNSMASMYRVVVWRVVAAMGHIAQKVIVVDGKLEEEVAEQAWPAWKLRLNCMGTND